MTHPRPGRSTGLVGPPVACRIWRRRDPGKSQPKDPGGDESGAWEERGHSSPFGITAKPYGSPDTDWVPPCPLVWKVRKSGKVPAVSFSQRVRMATLRHRRPSAQAGSGWPNFDAESKTSSGKRMAVLLRRARSLRKRIGVFQHLRSPLAYQSPRVAFLPMDDGSLVPPPAVVRILCFFCGGIPPAPFVLRMHNTRRPNPS